MGANDVIVKAWNGVLFDKLCRFEGVIDGLNRQVTRAVLDLEPMALGERVLDVGSGFGASTRLLAEAAGPAGRVVGVDCAENFVAKARADTGADSGSRVEYRLADAQSDPLGGPYSAAFSTFGTTFFTAPGAAFRHIRSALAPGAELTQVVWRNRRDNPWLYDAERCVRERVDRVRPEETDQVHCGPGPFSMAGANTVSDILLGAGFERIRLERLDLNVRLGSDLDEAAEFAVQLGPAGEAIRLAGADTDGRRPDLLAAVRETLKPRRDEDGSVRAPASAWVIRSRNPA
jgi:SAM-dependent methyltransferase